MVLNKKVILWRRESTGTEFLKKVVPWRRKSDGTE